MKTCATKLSAALLALAVSSAPAAAATYTFSGSFGPLSANQLFSTSLSQDFFVEGDLSTPSVIYGQARITNLVLPPAIPDAQLNYLISLNGAGFLQVCV